MISLFQVTFSSRETDSGGDGIVPAFLLMPETLPRDVATPACAMSTDKHVHDLLNHRLSLLVAFDDFICK